MKSLSTQLLVIGGGATGLGIAWDACLRGIKTVLVDKSDIAEGTSGRYHGLLHSGGRYALSDPQSARECAQENLILRRIAAPAIENTGGYFVSTPTDPLDYPDRWQKACYDCGVSCHEIPTHRLLESEPALNRRISRAFEVNDASLDSFDLAHLLLAAIQQAGGKILLRHEVKSLITKRQTVTAATLLDLQTNNKFSIEAELIINAGGPWSAQIANLAHVEIPLTLGKGTMLAMASRLTNAVVNRCKPPADGDIIVPVGTVSVLGTTDVKVDSPDALHIERWELELLLSEADVLIPGIFHHRALRAWSGIRPLYAHTAKEPLHNRDVTRSHVILDHREKDGIQNLISVIGGKLTTYRLMAEQAVNLASTRLGIDEPCLTSSTTLPSSPTLHHYRLGDRLSRIDRTPEDKHLILCECEIVSASDLDNALAQMEAPALDDLRRDLRLGMGPCQAAFCGFRAAGYLASVTQPPASLLADFTAERWKGIQALNWGQSIRQIELLRRINIELLNLPEVIS